MPDNLVRIIRRLGAEACITDGIVDGLEQLLRERHDQVPLDHSLVPHLREDGDFLSEETLLSELRSSHERVFDIRMHQNIAWHALERLGMTPPMEQEHE